MWVVRTRARSVSSNWCQSEDNFLSGTQRQECACSHGYKWRTEGCFLVSELIDVSLHRQTPPAAFLEAAAPLAFLFGPVCIAACNAGLTSMGPVTSLSCTACFAF